MEIDPFSATKIVTFLDDCLGNPISFMLIKSEQLQNFAIVVTFAPCNSALTYLLFVLPPSLFRFTLPLRFRLVSVHLRLVGLTATRLQVKLVHLVSPTRPEIRKKSSVILAICLHQITKLSCWWNFLSLFHTKRLSLRQTSRMGSIATNGSVHT